MSVSDTEMLDFIAAEYLDLVAFEMPTGQGDADVGWKALQHHQGEAKPREVGVSHHDDPRSAIRNAMQALAYRPRGSADSRQAFQQALYAWREARSITGPEFQAVMQLYAAASTIAGVLAVGERVEAECRKRFPGWDNPRYFGELARQLRRTEVEKELAAGVSVDRHKPLSPPATLGELK